MEPKEYRLLTPEGYGVRFVVNSEHTVLFINERNEEYECTRQEGRVIWKNYISTGAEEVRDIQP